METTPKDDPLLLAALVQGIIGMFAGIIAIARKEPKRLALLGLSVSAVAILAKFFLAALAVAIVIGIVIMVISG